MKKIFKYLALSLLVAGATSCEKEEIGGTAMQGMAGEWYVMVDGVDSNGEITYEDPFDMGYFPIFTYNTNANVATEMYINDEGNFWDFNVIVNVNYDAKTFNVTDAVMYYDEDDEGYEYPVHVSIFDGKIVKDGAVSPAGYTADSISFLVKFEDDSYIGQLWDALWIHGYRRTGLNGGYD